MAYLAHQVIALLKEEQSYLKVCRSSRRSLQATSDTVPLHQWLAWASLDHIFAVADRVETAKKCLGLRFKDLLAVLLRYLAMDQHHTWSYKTGLAVLVVVIRDQDLVASLHKSALFILVMLARD